MAYRLAPSLVRARTVIDNRWPGRDRASDGWIGDPAHQARYSDHNPNERGMVDAIDVDMFGGRNPVHRPSIVAGFILHPSTEYVIFNRRIFRKADRFRPRVYTGINPHTGHCHESISQTVAAEQNSTAWSVLAAFPSWPTLRKGIAVSSRQARELQAYLNAWGASLAVDGSIGTATDTAIRNFQRKYGLAVDGVVGTLTRRKLFS